MAEVAIKYGDFSFDEKKGHPVPKISFGINRSRTSAGDFLSSEQNITLDGICYIKKNTPSGDITELFFAAEDLKKQILENNYRTLTVTCGLDAPIFSGQNTVVDSIRFSENSNNWADTIDYSISLKVPTSGSGSALIPDDLGSYVTSVTDNYSLESMFDDQFWDRQYNRPIPTYKISRTIGAVGKYVNSPTGSLYWAKKWVRDRDTRFPFQNLFPENTFMLYNQERSVDVSEAEGSYRITDTFIAKSGSDPWMDNFSVSVNISKEYRISIDIEGSIQGLEPATGIYSNFVNVVDPPNQSIYYSGEKDIKPTISGYNPAGYDSNNGLKINSNNVATTKYRNAVSGWNILYPLLYQRASGYFNSSIDTIPSRFRNNIRNHTSLNPIPLSVSEQLYPFDGKITYRRSFDNRPEPLITGTVTETLTIDDTLPTLRHQETQVIGRRLGPVVYSYIDSFNIGSRSLTYVGTFPMSTGLAKYSFPKNIIREINKKISGYKPDPNQLGFNMPAYEVYIKEENQNLDINTNSFTYNITWEYSSC